MALSRHEAVASPTRSAPRPGAPVADAEEPIGASAGSGSRPARVDQCKAARPSALVKCSRSVGQPFDGRESVPRANLVFEGGPGGATQARGSMQLDEARVVRVALVLGVGGVSFEVAFPLVVELDFERSDIRSRCSSSQPFIVRGRHGALATRCRGPASPLRIAAHACAARTATVAVRSKKDFPGPCLALKGSELGEKGRPAHFARRGRSPGRVIRTARPVGIGVAQQAELAGAFSVLQRARKCSPDRHRGAVKR